MRKFVQYMIKLKNMKKIWVWIIAVTVDVTSMRYAFTEYINVKENVNIYSFYIRL